MNLIEATNYFLDEDEQTTGNTSIITKLIKMFHIDLSTFTDPKTLGDFLSKNKNKMSKAINNAESLSEGTVTEGKFGDNINKFTDDVIEKLAFTSKEYVTMLVIVLIASFFNIRELDKSINNTAAHYNTMNPSVLEQISQAIVDFEEQYNVTLQ